MPDASATSLLSALPAVDAVLRDDAFRAAAGDLDEKLRARLVRQVVERHRVRLLGENGVALPDDAAALTEAVTEACVEEAAAAQRSFPRRVVNATGILIHTNLGRAPLGSITKRFEAQALAGYSDLEWDAETQQRGDRDRPLRRKLRLLTGAESALVVNNCASAVLLALAATAAGKDVLVSRSELVEIGGSFRVPEIMALGGARLVEVGTTNKTRLADYRDAATPGKSVLLKVHQANFVQRGFVESVPVQKLIALGEELGLPVIEDNGSGLIAREDAPLLRGEPRVLASLAAGVDLLCSSGDKLFGGLQAGLILGKSAAVETLRAHPLYRALRLDKVRMALMDRTLAFYLEGRARELPLWQLFHTDWETLEKRAEKLSLPGSDSRWKSCRLAETDAKLGGGANPEKTFASLGLELAHAEHSAEALKRRFARRAVPIAGYVREGHFHLDLRTVFPDDLAEIQDALDALA